MPRTKVRFVDFQRALQLNRYLAQAHQVAAQALLEMGVAHPTPAGQTRGVAGSQIQGEQAQQLP